MDKLDQLYKLYKDLLEGATKDEYQGNRQSELMKVIQEGCVHRLKLRGASSFASIG